VAHSSIAAPRRGEHLLDIVPPDPKEPYDIRGMIAEIIDDVARSHGLRPI